MNDVVQTLVQELLNEVKAARETAATAAAHDARVKELMIKLRLAAPDRYGPADLEELSDRYHDRGTISRFTAPAFPDGKPPRKRTRRKPGT